MSYVRRNVQDGTTIMNADLYNNLQDGIDDLFTGLAGVRMSYNATTKHLVIGGVADNSQQSGGGEETPNNGYTEEDILSPDDIDGIFDEAQSEVDNEDNEGE